MVLGCFFCGFFVSLFFNFFCAAKSVPASWVEGTVFSKAAVVSPGDLVVAEGAEVRSFYRFTGTKVQILRGVGRRSGCGGGCGGTQFSRFTGTKVQILTF